jgi:hypothetical protein
MNIQAAAALVHDVHRPLLFWATAERGGHAFTEGAVRASRDGSDNQWCLRPPGSKC